MCILEPRWFTGLALLAACTVACSLPASAEDPPATDEETLTLEAHPVAVDRLLLPPPTAVDRREEYEIGRHDLLEVTVFGVEELDQTVRVADDGSISLPLLGRLNVAGVTKTELERMLAELLAARFVRDPQVTIFVKEYESRKVAVTGAVQRPGTYDMLGRRTLLEMVSMAGGLGSDLGNEIIIFRRNEDGPSQRIPIDLERLVYQADPALNLVIEPGDIVYVPTVQKIRIFVSGAVKNPDLYEIPRDEPVTVLKAVTLAGGTTDRAAEKKVQVIRTDANGERIALFVNLRKVKRGKAEDPILQKDDIVLVPEAFF